MQVVKIVENVYRAHWPWNQVNAGFVMTGAGVVVIDSGPSPAAGRELRAAIAEITDEPVVYLVNTHFHSSHTFGNQAFDVPILAHAGCYEKMHKAVEEGWTPETSDLCVEDAPPPAPDLEDLEITPPEIGFEDAGLIAVGDTVISVNHVGCHSPDSIVVHSATAGVVFAGDNLFSGKHPFLRHANASQWIEVLRKVEALDFTVAVPGHGREMEKKDVRNLRVYFESLLRPKGGRPRPDDGDRQLARA